MRKRISRREALRLSLAAGASLGLGCGDDTPGGSASSTSPTGPGTTAGMNSGSTNPSGVGSSGTGDAPDEPDAIVIGTGFGGAVAALRLGEAGIRTVMLERGRRWPITPEFDTFSLTFPPDGRSTWLRKQTVLPFGPSGAIDRFTGVLERIDTPNINVYTGAAVGGSSVVYGGMTVQPSQANFERVFPAEVSYPQLDEIYYPRVRDMLSASLAPKDIAEAAVFEYARQFDLQAKAAGLTVRPPLQATDWDIIRAEIAGDLPPSATIGELIYGANTGWKNSLDKNYLPAAEATGQVTIQELHQVREIGREGDRWVLEVDRIDDNGDVIESFTMITRLLFMAAGSMATPKLLLEARERGNLPNLNDAVGQGWGSNGNTMFLRSNLGVETGALQGGPPITALEHADNTLSPVLVEAAQFPTGFETGSLLSLAVTIDETRGSFEFDAGSDSAALTWPKNGNAQAAAAVMETVDVLNDANGGQITGNLVGGLLTDFTYHPLGGMVMGQACDLLGRVEGYPNLYVIDGSLIPGSGAVANPSWTIAAIAERNIEAIIAEDLS